MGSTGTARIRNRIHVRSNEKIVREKVSTMALAVMYFVGILIGLWSFAALTGGLITGGGPLGLVKGYLQAVTGF